MVALGVIEGAGKCERLTARILYDYIHRPSRVSRRSTGNSAPIQGLGVDAREPAHKYADTGSLFHSRCDRGFGIGIITDADVFPADIKASHGVGAVSEYAVL